ncbi:uncharacterized protein LOC131332860 [Rhododendron vialii]|uniref:uncharacterized protein LOC131332860 n=1 Tax=Rhododendron vialii TaxID=182163 RepID=UPI00265E4DD2|nr:uncharacterized protein LOC131332860 [Rhododendron vialii]
MLAYPVRLISRMDSLKYLFEKPTLTGKLARWLLMLAEFELKYVTRKSVKGRAIAEFLADHPVKGGKDAEFKFPNEDLMTIAEDVWKLYFDGAANQEGFGIGVLLISPNGSHILFAFKLNFEVTNNQAEYEACIVDMEAAIEIGVEKLEKVKEEKLKPYHQDLEDLIPHSNKVTFTHVPRLNNQFADVLATLASMVKIPIRVKLRKRRISPEASKKDRIALQRLASRYIICEGNMYQRSHCGMHKLCIHREEAKWVMEEIHEGVCGLHMNGMMLAKKILRQGYFWSTMETKCIEYVRRCNKCQIHVNLMHVPPSELYQMTSPWPFSVCGTDVIGRITPAASNGHKFILVAIDYFTKWVEATSYATLTAIQVAHFIKQNVIYRYWVPQAFISDNGVHFKGRAKEVLEEF